MKCSELAQPWKQEINWWLSGAGGKGDTIMQSVKGHKTSSGGDEKVLELDSADSCATL